MPEIGMSVSMSGDGKRGVGHRPQATAPILDSTFTSVLVATNRQRSNGKPTCSGQAWRVEDDPSLTSTVYRSIAGGAPFLLRLHFSAGITLPKSGGLHRVNVVPKGTTLTTAANQRMRSIFASKQEQAV
jgi:hypothetical protein